MVLCLHRQPNLPDWAVSCTNWAFFKHKFVLFFCPIWQHCRRIGAALAWTPLTNSSSLLYELNKNCNKRYIVMLVSILHLGIDAIDTQIDTSSPCALTRLGIGWWKLLIILIWIYFLLIYFDHLEIFNDLIKGQLLITPNTCSSMCTHFFLSQWLNLFFFFLILTF